MRVLAFLALSVLVIGCTAKPTPTSERHSKLPTATEVFNLRTKCAQLGRELDESLQHGPAIYQDVVSNYSIKSNRCYVTVEDSDASFTNRHRIRSLYDGQTRELLAFAEHYSQSQPDGRDTNGKIFEENNIDTTIDCHPNGDCGFAKATTYIDERMKREE